MRNHNAVLLLILFFFTLNGTVISAILPVCEEFKIIQIKAKTVKGAKYPFKSGIIKCRQKQSKNYSITYFDDFGKLEYIKKVYYIANKETLGNILIKDNIIYHWAAGMGSQRAYLPFNQIRPNFLKIEQIQTTKKIKLDKLDDDNVFNKKCKVYKITAEAYSITYYLWSNILLREKAVFYDEIVTEIIKNPKINKKIFELPKGIDFVEY